ncbi:MAG: XrtA/PEP-CTERM system histidine kinase PrsK [bacterium]
MNVYSLPTLANCISIPLFAFFVLYQGRSHFANKVFFLAMLSVGIMEFGNVMVLNSTSPMKMLYWGRISLAGCCLIPVSWSLFSMVFTRCNYETISKRSKVILSFISIFTFCFLILIPFDLFIYLPSDPLNENIILLGTAGRAFTAFLLLTITFIMSNLEMVYLNSGSKRRQIKYSIVGLFAVFTFYIYLISRVALFRFVDLIYIPIGSTVIFICLWFLAFSFIRHRLMNVEIFVSRQVFYGSFTLIAISIYLILVGFTGELIKIIGINFNLVFYPVLVLASLVALSIFCLSEKNRKMAKRFIDRHFYRNKFDYRFEWIELTNRISAVVDLNDLLGEFMELIAETMCVSEIAIWLYDDEDKKFHLSSTRHLLKYETEIDKNSPLIRYLEEKAEPFSLSMGSLVSDSVLDELYKRYHEEIWDRYRVSTISPLMVKDELIGFLSLGDEVTGAVYNYEDYDMLKTMCHQAASAIMNIKLSERIACAKGMAVMNKVSSFVIHDLKNFVSMLSLIVQNASQNMGNVEFQKDVLETISKTIGNMNKLMIRISRPLEEVVLNKTKVNLTALVKEVIQSTGLGTNGIALVEGYADLPEINLDHEKIQSVIRNIIINAQESLKGRGKVSISTFFKDKTAVIEVKDNGPGMSREFLNNKLFKPFQTTKKNGLGIGLYQCKQIISAHDGRIEVESEEGMGTIFWIYLPVDNWGAREYISSPNGY